MLIFVDKLNFFELYNSVKTANEQAPQLDLQSTVNSLEEKYAALIAENASYLALNQTRHSPEFNLVEETQTPDEEPKKIE